MATRTKWGLSRGAMPDPSNTTDPAFRQPFTILATNDVWRHGVWIFGQNNAAQPTVRIGIYRTFVVPDDYISTPLWVVDWSSTLTTGDVVWDADMRTVGGNDTTSYDQAGTERASTVTDTAPGAALRRLEVAFAGTLVSGDFTAGERVEVGFFRDGADAADTMAGSAILFDFGFRYNTT